VREMRHKMMWGACSNQRSVLSKHKFKPHKRGANTKVGGAKGEQRGQIQ